MLTTRRQFLVQGIGVTATLSALPALTGALAPRTNRRERVLVVLQLSGGNDGLNTVIPRTQDAYFRLRPTLAVGSNAVHALDKHYGLHPSMNALAEVFEEGKLAVVHGIGHLVAERSHFRSMEIWHTASSALPLPASGWLGRLADQISERAPGSMPALHIGGGMLPLALRGEGNLAPTVRDPGGFLLSPNNESFASARNKLLNASDAKGDLAFLRGSATSTYHAAERMAELTSNETSVAYPNTELGRQLELVARLISGDFGTRIFQVELGGFDHHSRQAPAHQALLAQLSNALAAFQQDLDESGDADRVMTLAFSEFGRRAAENGSRGTDHGAGAPAFVMGSRVKRGLHGTAPDLERLVDGDVAVTTDFRSVYSALEKDWLGLKPSTSVAPLDLLS